MNYIKEKEELKEKLFKEKDQNEAKRK